ncbi:hypothetical protein C9I50_24675 [Pseudomonas prosekii]|uniref:hypothetical protein n=1 Tax=Pseudomonas prosekii TaxID=1148509 RepID=UPI000D619FD0|nr:hypothetical protein [Pseudomonas prosekii]PWE37932.1 hypothetical protein C9I50_24675 [Pseudomonas prosekii]
MTNIKERPILFSAPMVRAILEGRKTVTRRLVKDWQIPTEDASVAAGERHRWMAIAQRHPRYGFGVFGATEADCAKELEDFAPCPYGRRGERLWVREAWAADAQVDAVAPRDLSQGEPIRYPADGAVRQAGCSMITPGKGRPSIHMPRWASRILLEITDVRVERLQDISEEQASAEGVSAQAVESFRVAGVDRPAGFAFRDLWTSINGDENWTVNPWVWVVEFKRVTP